MLEWRHTTPSTYPFPRVEHGYSRMRMSILHLDYLCKASGYHVPWRRDGAGVGRRRYARNRPVSLWLLRVGNGQGPFTIEWRGGIAQPGYLI